MWPSRLVKAGLAKAEPPTPKITEKQATSQAEQAEQAEQEGEKPSPTLSGIEAGKRDGTRYGHQLVDQWYVRKNETKKTPTFKPLSSQKMTEQWIAYAAKVGYKTQGEQAAYATAKKQAVDETFCKGTGYQAELGLMHSLAIRICLRLFHVFASQSLRICRSSCSALTRLLSLLKDL